MPLNMPVVHPDMDILIQSRDPEAASDIHDERRKWRVYSAKLSRPHPDSLAVHDEDVEVRGRTVATRIYRHKGATGLQPCVLYLHGGGFVKGDLDASDSIAWGYAHDSGAMVVSVDYRLAPENPWPAGFDDCYDVLQALVERPDHFGVDPTRIVVGGESAGGFLAASVSLRARDEKLVDLAGQLIVYGAAGTADDSLSSSEFAEGFNLVSKDVEKYHRALFGKMENYRADPYAWPISNPDLSRLPPAFVHSAEIDPIRDDGRAYAARLLLAGNDVCYREAKGMLHGFLRARFTGAAAKREYDAVISFIRNRIQTP